MTTKLLSGGNPQIPKGEGDEPVQTYIAAMPGWKSDIGRRLDRLIQQAVPDVRKAVKWNTPLYGLDGWFAGFHCCNQYVKVAFFQGSLLNPKPPVESKQDAVRYLHVYEGEPLDEEQFLSWIKQASQLSGVRM